MNDEEVTEIVNAIVKNFRCFGGGQGTAGNPIAHALKDRPPVFAAGVDVEDVVRFVIQQVEA